MTSRIADLNRKLAAIFANGVGEIGLEVGTDPGLPSIEHIRIPRSMRRNWHVRIANDENGEALAKAWGLKVEGGGKKGKGKAKEYITVHANDLKANGKLYIHEGILFISSGTLRVECLQYGQTPVSLEMMADFYVVNDGHVREHVIGDTHARWVHAVRLWSVLAGFATPGEDCGAAVEWEEVETPDGSTENAAAVDFADFAMGYAAEALTACAARAGTWRKTNHATGGTLATGFARRWISKAEWGSKSKDKEVRAAEDLVVSSAFYIATHAASVHVILACAAPGNTSHWAHLNPDYGYIHEWKTRDSARIRLEPNTQVAGAAWVADSKVVLEMMVKEGISPLLNNREQIPALMAAHAVVEEHGIACAVYGKWFLKNHPDEDMRDPVTFDQKSPAFSSLVGELAWVSKLYYRGTTISGSAALGAATIQASDTVAEEAWRAIGAARASSSADQIVAVYTAIKGGATRSGISDILNADDAVARKALASYNARAAEDAAALNLTAPIVANVETVLAARGATAAQ